MGRTPGEPGVSAPRLSTPPQILLYLVIGMSEVGGGKGDRLETESSHSCASTLPLLDHGCSPLQDRQAVTSDDLSIQYPVAPLRLCFRNTVHHSFPEVEFCH
jgi:hypothetical protein